MKKMSSSSPPSTTQKTDYICLFESLDTLNIIFFIVIGLLLIMDSGENLMDIILGLFLFFVEKVMPDK